MEIADTAFMIRIDRCANCLCWCSWSPPMPALRPIVTRRLGGGGRRGGAKDGELLRAARRFNAIIEAGMTETVSRGETASCRLAVSEKFFGDLSSGTSVPARRRISRRR